MDGVFETIDHAAAFPAKIFITQISRCAFHWHHDNEIILVLKGTVTVFHDAGPTTLYAGDLFLFNTRAIHGVQRTAEDNLLLCLQFSPQLVDASLYAQQFYHHFYLNSTSELYPPQKPYDHFVFQLINLFLAAQQQSASAALRAHSQLLAFLADMLDYVQYDVRRMPLAQAEDTHNEFCEQMLAYMDEHLRSEHLAQELCREFGLSEKTLYRYLKSTLGLSFKELYDVVRVEKACAMLTENKKSVSAIWDYCGFASEVSFYRNFKKQLGITPREYRSGKSKRTGGAGTEEEGYAGFNLGAATKLLRDFVDAYQYLEGAES